LHLGVGREFFGIYLMHCRLAVFGARGKEGLGRRGIRERLYSRILDALSVCELTLCAALILI